MEVGYRPTEEAPHEIIRLSNNPIDDSVVPILFEIIRVHILGVGTPTVENETFSSLKSKRVTLLYFFPDDLFLVIFPTQ